MTNIYMKVSVLAGSDIGNVAIEAIELAKKWGIGVNFVFNGVNLMAYSGSTDSGLVDRYKKEISTQQAKGAS